MTYYLGNFNGGFQGDRGKGENTAQQLNSLLDNKYVYDYIYLKVENSENICLGYLRFFC